MFTKISPSGILSEKGGVGMLFYKMDVLDKLSDAGYSTYRIRKEKRLSESSIQKIREGVVIGGLSLNAICEMLNCQPGDVIGYKKEGA